MIGLKKWRMLTAALIVVLVIVIAGCGGTAGKAALPEANKASIQGSGAGVAITVKVLDVGQGDAILIRTAGQVTLIDTGDVPARDKLVSMLKNQGVTTIDKLIVTHPHADHLGGVAAVFENFSVKQVYDSGQKTTTNLYRQYVTTVHKKNIPFSVVTAGTVIDLGSGAILKVLAPDQPFIAGTDSDLNNNSIVAKLVYGTFSLLLAGDAEQEAEDRMLKKDAAVLKSALLKSGHHGSRTSSSMPFLKAVSPEAALISLGANNDYHHPHPSTLKKYSEKSIKVYRTDTDGTLEITTDGKTYNIAKER